MIEALLWCTWVPLVILFETLFLGVKAIGKWILILIALPFRLFFQGLWYVNEGFKWLDKKADEVWR